jgi:hypothetical protein
MAGGVEINYCAKVLEEHHGFRLTGESCGHLRHPAVALPAWQSFWKLQGPSLPSLPNRHLGVCGPARV